MICPACGSERNYVRETAQGTDGKIYRRRRCYDCDLRFHTVESVVADDESRKGYSEAINNKSGFLKNIMKERNSK